MTQAIQPSAGRLAAAKTTSRVETEELKKHNPNGPHATKEPKGTPSTKEDEFKDTVTLSKPSDVQEVKVDLQRVQEKAEKTLDPRTRDNLVRSTFGHIS